MGTVRRTHPGNNQRVPAGTIGSSSWRHYYMERSGQIIKWGCKPVKSASMPIPSSKCLSTNGLNRYRNPRLGGFRHKTASEQRFNRLQTSCRAIGSRRTEALRRRPLRIHHGISGSGG